jgi:hypothetical protein
MSGAKGKETPGMPHPPPLAMPGVLLFQRALTTRPGSAVDPRLTLTYGAGDANPLFGDAGHHDPAGARRSLVPAPARQLAHFRLSHERQSTCTPPASVPGQTLSTVRSAASARIQPLQTQPFW